MLKQILEGFLSKLTPAYLLALILILTICYLFVTERIIPPLLATFAGSVVTYYLGEHNGHSNGYKKAKAEEAEHAELYRTQ